MPTPQTMIQQRLRARIATLGLKTYEVAERVGRTELYGDFSPGTVRNLMTFDYESERKPRTTFNKQLIIALSEALECQTSDLATDLEMSTLRDVPYRRAQFPTFMREEVRAINRKARVPSPQLTVKRLRAYMIQRGNISYADMAQRMTDNGYPISSKQLVRAIGDNRDATTMYRHMTFAFCEVAAVVFRGRLGRDEFDPEWLITCRPDYCPHCYPILQTG